MKNILLITLLCLFPFTHAVADESGLQTAVAVDITADTDTNADSTRSSDQLFIREAEVMFFGPIDHLFDGQFSLAAHPEDGATLFEVHEAFISSSKLVPRSRVQLGQFFLGLGRLNQIHRHDWAFIEAPEVHRQYFDSEAAIDSGLQWSTLLPLPFYLDVTVGVTNGYTYGHSHDAGAKPRKPTRYLRLATFMVDNTALGLNWLSREDATGKEMTLTGLDVTFKDREGKTLNWLVQSEIWTRTIKEDNIDPDKSWGSYIYVQKGFTPTLAAGLRHDYYTVTSTKNILGDKVDNYHTVVEPSLTWKPSEFSTLRLAYQSGKEYLKSSYDNKIQRVLLQTTYIMGAHPAHDF